MKRVALAIVVAVLSGSSYAQDQSSAIPAVDQTMSAAAVNATSARAFAWGYSFSENWSDLPTGPIYPTEGCNGSTGCDGLFQGNTCTWWANWKPSSAGCSLLVSRVKAYTPLELSGAVVGVYTSAGWWRTDTGMTAVLINPTTEIEFEFYGEVPNDTRSEVILQLRIGDGDIFNSLWYRIDCPDCRDDVGRIDLLPGHWRRNLYQDLVDAYAAAGMDFEAWMARPGNLYVESIGIYVICSSLSRAWGELGPISIVTQVPPIAYIDSIIPHIASVGDTVYFGGHGEDPDGGSITDYEWRSDLDSILSASPSFATDSLSAGLHTISLRVKDNSGLWSPEAIEWVQIDQPQVVGACCVPIDEDWWYCRSATSEAVCSVLEGTYQGDYSTCDPNPCPVAATGACCFGESCDVATNEACSQRGGIYRGDGSTCEGVVCGPPSPPECNALMDAATGDKLIIAFTHSSPWNVTYYEIYANESNGPDLLEGTLSESGFGSYRFVVDGLKEHVSYYLTVRACNVYGCSEMTYCGTEKPTVPVFLVYGLGDRSSSMLPLKERLESAGVDFNYVFSVDNIDACGGADRASFDGNALALSNFIALRLYDIEQHTGVEVPQIDIVGHSMGGLIARRYNSIESRTDWPNKTPVRTMVMLGTPNTGSELADKPGALQSLFTNCPEASPAFDELKLSQMLRYNGTYHDDPATNYYALWGGAGTRFFCMGSIPGRLLPTPNDGAVTKGSAIGCWNNITMFSNNLGSMEWCHAMPNSYVTEYEPQNHVINALLVGGQSLATAGYAGIVDTPLQRIHEAIDKTLQGAVISDSFYVEPSAILTVIFTSVDSLMSYTIESPLGQVYDSTTSSLDSSEIYLSDSVNMRAFVIREATSGWWQWVVDASHASIPVIDYAVLATCDNEIRLMESQNLEILGVNDSLVLNVNILDGGSPLTGLSVTGLQVWNGADSSGIELYDLGDAGDGSANDGVYGVVLKNFSDTGIVEIHLIITGMGSVGKVIRISRFLAYVRSGCCIGRVGDANGSNEPADEVTLGDIMLMVDVKFISSDCSKLPCLTEADVNQDGGTDPNCDDHVTLGDIMTLVDFLFITGPETATLPNCL